MIPTQDNPATRQHMHGKSSEERNAFFSLLQKDSKAHGAVTREYVGQWATKGNCNSYGDDNNEGDVEAARETRKGRYMSLVNK